MAIDPSPPRRPHRAIAEAVASPILSGTIRDSPWGVRSTDSMFDQVDSNDNHGRENGHTVPLCQASLFDPSPSTTTIGRRLLKAVLYLWHALDIALSVYLFLCGLVACFVHPWPQLAVVVYMIAGTLLLSRGVAGVSALQLPESSCVDCLWILNRHSSVWLGAILLVACPIVAVQHQALLRYWHNHHLYWKASDAKFWAKYGKFLWLWLLVGAVLELVRWHVLHYYHGMLQADEDLELNRSSLQSLHDESIKPWWWSLSPAKFTRRGRRRTNNASLNEALLDDNDGTGLPRWVSNNDNRRQQRPQRRNRWISFWRRDEPQSGQGDDEEELDFQSVQEEWASRTEEDPFWWATDERRDSQDTSSAWQ